VSNWLEYEEFVDRIRGLHHQAFTGLVTGLSDSKHSFQIGFENGDIMLLAYRVSKGSVALDRLLEIERAKIAVHPTVQVPPNQMSLPTTSDILDRLTSNTLSRDTELEYSDVDIDESEQPEIELDGSNSEGTHSKLKTAIESAAIHHFGPIGTMICDDFLADNDVSGKNYRAIMSEIANEVGASKPETDAFINSVANS